MELDKSIIFSIFYACLLISFTVRSKFVLAAVLLCKESILKGLKTIII